MLKFWGRKSAEANLRLFDSYVSRDESLLPEVRLQVALLLRGALKSVGLNPDIYSKSDDPVSALLIDFECTVPDELAKEMAHQALRTADKIKKFAGISEGYLSNSLLFAYFQIVGQTPDPRTIAKNAPISGLSKSEFLLLKLRATLKTLFSQDAGMLTSDEAEQHMKSIFG